MVERAVMLLAVDPAGLRGLWLRGRAGPVRDRVLAGLSVLGPRKVHPFITDEALMGGMDLSSTLVTGSLRRHAGLLECGGLLTLTMAERCPPGLAARLGQALDRDRTLGLVALDEAAEEGEGLPSVLADRLGMFLDLDGFAWADTGELVLNSGRIADARQKLGDICTPDDTLPRLVSVAAELGISSLRAPLLALACARANAALRRARKIEESDLRIAVSLCFAHKARQLPEDASDPENPPPDPTEPSADNDGNNKQPETDIPSDMLIDAARAVLPPGVLAQLQATQMSQASRGASGAGQKRKSRRRGRPLPARAGKPGSGARVDVIATLRQAAPWQKVRRSMMPDRAEGRLLLLPSDIRIKRYEDQTDRLLIFVVDASGSAALARLAEAKGAVELMLADAYSSRDHVALVAFRGHVAELSLPPSRSLVQAKRRLAGLPGGGATPLAGALRLALQTAEQARGHGMSPTLAFLTDGRGNIALDGSANRVQAGEDAAKMARAIAARNIPALIIDTSLRPKPQLSDLSAQMGARLIALPRADAHMLSTTLAAALGAQR